jgi:hypothetical protein
MMINQNENIYTSKPYHRSTKPSKATCFRHFIICFKEYKILRPSDILFKHCLWPVPCIGSTSSPFTRHLIIVLYSGTDCRPAVPWFTKKSAKANERQQQLIDTVYFAKFQITFKVRHGLSPFIRNRMGTFSFRIKTNHYCLTYALHFVCINIDQLL